MQHPAEKHHIALFRSFEDFFRIEAMGGVILMFSTVAALVWANSSYAPLYDTLRELPVTVGLGSWVLSKPALLWINDGLMAIFFFVVGLEIKREVLVGGLSTPSQTVMPVAAAVGGMVAPALIYLALNSGTPTAGGWGVAMATDIAFALGILSLLGPRVPIGLKIFLTAVAIVDDIGAILVIALFYTAELSLPALGLGFATLGVMLLLNWLMNVRSPIPYLVLGIIVWFAFLKSGIHATIAGVLAAATIPAGTNMDCSRFVSELRHAADTFELAITPGKTVLTNKEQQLALHAVEEAHKDAATPLQMLEHALHPWVSFLIMPIFALANAGVALRAELFAQLASPLVLGIFLGLVAGKQIGVTLACWLMRRLGWAEYPHGTSLGHIYGAGCLAGVGFTMSIFIANLAFAGSPEAVELAKLAVLITSLAAGLVGYFVLRAQPSHR